DELADANQLVFSADRLHRLKEGWALAAQCLYVVPGAEFGQLSDDSYCIDPASEDDYRRLIEALVARGRLPRHVVHA
ncbi:hypothetical protein AAHH79_43395, partial [Burkholderia pseudomallei]